jgi:multidrug efflux system outer membrane protein
MARLPLAVAALSSLLAGCAVAPDYQRPQTQLPAQWEAPLQSAMQAQAGQARWWQRYDDPVLDRLVAQALESNLDVLAAAARVREARAQLGLARADRYPTLDAQADAARSDQGELQPGGPRNSFRVAGVLAYEVDLWGRLSSASEAARARLLQTTFSAQAVQLQLVTDLVTSYFDLRALEQQVRTTLATIEARREAHRLEQVQYRAGATTELTLHQAEAELAQTQAQLPHLRRQAAQVRRALAILAGQSPEQVVTPAELELVPLNRFAFSTALPQRLPSELLERRPDIRAAEAGLVAANADIGTVRAAWLPRLNLAASLGSGATEFSHLFSGPAMLWQLGSSLFAPLFDFGRREAQIETAEARRELAELQYRAAVRDAFREVGDAWTLLETASERLGALDRQVKALEAALVLADSRYRNGYSPYLEVLDARRALFAAELARIEARRDRLSATALLYKALGGGWQEER